MGYIQVLHNNDNDYDYDNIDDLETKDHNSSPFSLKQTTKNLMLSALFFLHLEISFFRIFSHIIFYGCN